VFFFIASTLIGEIAKQVQKLREAQSIREILVGGLTIVI
jgi:hypothetical protein